jgi:tetratricopeptide (TPR) repeat protein
LATTPEPAAAKPFFEKIEKKDKKADDKDAGDTPLVTATGNETAHRVLAWDHIQHGEFNAASEELNDAVSLNPRDMWIRYYLSVLKYRISVAKHTDILGLPNMMLDLRTVLEWYPEFAEAYDLMATARREGGGPVAAMQAERAAMQLSPRNQQYVYHLAEIYISDKKFDAARALLERLKTSDNTQVAAAARDRLTQLPNEQKYGLSAAGMSAEKQLAPQKSPFDVLEEDAAKRAVALKAAQTGGTADTRPAKFLQGRLLDVDCSQSPAAVLTVRAGGTILKLRTADYKSLLLIGADSFSCAWSNRAVSVNYKPGGVADGDVLSVELR